MKQRFSVAFTIIILGTVIGFFINRPRFKKDTNDFGRSFNNERQKIGVPKIEENWFAHNSDSTGTTRMNKSHLLETKAPHHFAKSVELSKGQLISEEDSYNKFLNDSVDCRIFYEYSYGTKQWHCKMSTHHYGSYPPSEVVELTLIQADSIINSWGLTRE